MSASGKAAIALPSGLKERSAHKHIAAACAQFGLQPARACYHRGPDLDEIGAFELLVADVSRQDERVLAAIETARAAGKTVLLTSYQKRAAPDVIRYTTSERGLGQLREALVLALRDELDVSAPVICITNQKGGVGKTTSVINLAAAFVHSRPSVLVIDFDPQANVSSILLDERREDLFDHLEQGRPLEKLIQPSTRNDRIHVIGTRWRNHPFNCADYTLLGKAIEGLRENYDYVLIDTSAGVDDAVRMAWQASDYVVVPTDLSVQSLKTLHRFIPFVQSQQKPAGFQLLGVFFTLVQPKSVAESKTTIRTELEKLIKNQKVHLLRKHIRLHDSIAKGVLHGRGVLETNTKSRAKNDYLRLAEEIEQLIGPHATS